MILVKAQEPIVAKLCPKTGCNTFRNTVREHYAIEQRTPFHGYHVPDEWAHYSQMTVIRKPPFWLRSFWGDRTRSRWVPLDGSSSPIWAEICNHLQPPNPMGWEDFWRWYVTHRAGFLYYVFEKYTKDCTYVGRNETLADFLKIHFPRVKEVGVHNVGPNLPKISPVAIVSIEDAEMDIMNKYYTF